jgi:hypothetical protein
MKITEDQVFEVIESFGTSGATKKQIAKRLGTAIETPTYRAEQLIKAGLVMKGKHGLEVVYIMKPKVPPAMPSFTQPIKPVNTIPALADTELFKQNAETLEREYRREVGMSPSLGTSYGPAVTRVEGLDELVNSFVESLASQITARLRPMLVERLKDSVAAMTEEIVAKPIEFPKPKPYLPSVLIGGLKGDQVEMFTREFEGVADLRFVGADEGTSVWKSRAAHAKHTVLMVDFLSHKHVEQLKAMGVCPIEIRGGMTKLRDKLMELSV